VNKDEAGTRKKVFRWFDSTAVRLFIDPFLAASVTAFGDLKIRWTSLSTKKSARFVIGGHFVPGASQLWLVRLS
jgi:hypothetical protein